MTDQYVEHHGVKGQRWGVRRPDGPDGTVTGTGSSNKSERSVRSSKRSESKSSTSGKPSSSSGPKSQARARAENREALLKEIETLKSMGNMAAAKKLEDQLKADDEAKPDEMEDLAAKPGEDEGEEDEEEKGKKGKGKGAAAAAPKKEKPDPAIEAAKKEAARLKAERSKWQTLAKTQRETARAFSDAASDARQKAGELQDKADAINQRLPGFRQDLEKAKAAGDKGAIKTISEMINRLRGDVMNFTAEAKAQMGIASSLSAKSDEWNTKVDESLAEMAAVDEEVKDKIKHGEDYIAHYGVKGQRWGVRKDRSKKKSSTPKLEFKTSSDSRKKEFDRLMSRASEYDKASAELEAHASRVGKDGFLSERDALKENLRSKHGILKKAADDLDDAATSNLNSREENEALSKLASDARSMMKWDFYWNDVHQEVDLAVRVLNESSKQNRKDAMESNWFDDVRHGEDYIAHYGVKGQRWGVRRTAEQLGRLGKRPNARQAQREASKEAATLSDKELRDRVNRLNLEKQYSDLVKQQVERDRTAMQEGLDEVTKILGQQTRQSIGNVYGKTLTYGLTAGANKTGVVNIKKK